VTNPINYEPTAAQVQSSWWMHDARWYQGVLERFGQQAANEINREAVEFVARRIGAVMAKRLGRSGAELSWDDVLGAYRACVASMWSPTMMSYECESAEPGSFEIRVSRSYALVMLRLAKSLEGYQCPCLDMRRGWIEGLGLTFTSDRVVSCLRDGGDSCTYDGRVAGFKDAPEHDRGSG